MTPADVKPMASIVVEEGALVVFFVVVLLAVGWWLVKVLPEDRKWRRQMDTTMVEMLGLSRQALETANTVVVQNSEELRMSRESHQRLGERMESLEERFGRHDLRAEGMAKDIAVIKDREV